MADTGAPAPAGNPAASAPAATPLPAAGPGTGAASSPSPVPAWVPETLKSDWGSPDYAEKATKAYADSHAKLSTRHDDFRKQVSAEVEAERLKLRPETPDGYKFEVKPGSDIETLLRQNAIELVDEAPADGGKPGMYVLNHESETLKAFKEWSHKHAIPADAFNEMVAHVVLRDVRKTKENGAAQEKLYAEQDKAEIAKLGPQGEQRRTNAEAAIKARMVTLLGPEKGAEAGQALALACVFAGGVEGLESLLGGSAGGLQPGGGGESGKVVNFESMFPKTAAHYAKKG